MKPKEDYTDKTKLSANEMLHHSRGYIIIAMCGKGIRYCYDIESLASESEERGFLEDCVETLEDIMDEHGFSQRPNSVEIDSEAEDEE